MKARVLEPHGEVDARELTRHAISVRSMNFGQHWRGSQVQEVAGILWIPCNDILDLVNDFLLDWKKDSELHPDHDDEFEVWLRERHWPQADEVMQSQEGLAMIIDYLAHDILEQAFGDAEPRPPGVVVNQVENPSIQDGILQVGFKGREAGSSTAYQD